MQFLQQEKSFNEEKCRFGLRGGHLAIVRLELARFQGNVSVSEISQQLQYIVLTG